MNTQRTVLILQADGAYWFRLMHNAVMETYIETIAPGQAQQGCKPDWMKKIPVGEPQWVELVLDTTLDEVDRVAVAQSDKRWVNHYRRWTTLRRLRRDYAQSKVYPLPSGNTDNVAGLMHIVFPDVWNDYLSAHQAADVVFHSVLTGTELVADWARQFDLPTLIVMPVADDQRHVLVDAGQAVFLRTVHVAGRPPGQTNNSLITEQTLEYLKSHTSLSGDLLDVVEPGSHTLIEAEDPTKNSDDHAERALSAGKAGHHLLQTDSLTSQRVNCLLSMLLGLPAEHTTYTWCIESGLQRSQNSIVLKPGSRIEGRRHSLKNEICRIVDRVFDRRNDRRGSGAIPPGKIPLLQSMAQSIQVFSPSILRLKSFQRKNRIHALSIAFVTLASFIAMAAIANGLLTNRLVHSQVLEQAMVERLTQGKIEKAAALHRNSGVAAAGLLLADQLAATTSMTAASLFERVGSAVTAVPGVTLDGMVWVPVSPDEAYDTLAYAINSVPQREAIDTSTDSWVQQVELSGRVSGSSLKDQKRHLDLFTDALKQLPGATAVSTLESPVDMALSSESDDRESAYYRLSLQLGGV